jgi:hypothetical protein
MDRLAKLVWASRFENCLNLFKHLWNEMAPAALIWHTSIEAHLAMCAEIQKMLEPSKGLTNVLDCGILKNTLKEALCASTK